MSEDRRVRVLVAGPDRSIAHKSSQLQLLLNISFVQKTNAKTIFQKNIHWLIRITLAITFIVHGYPKLGGNLDMGFIGYLVGPFEVIGGILLLLGPIVNNANLTRLGGMLISIIMLGAIFVVHLNDGWKGMEWQILILTTCLLFVAKGNDV